MGFGEEEGAHWVGGCEDCVKGWALVGSQLLAKPPRKLHVGCHSANFRGETGLSIHRPSENHAGRHSRTRGILLAVRSDFSTTLEVAEAKGIREYG
jgi:hypothetical protein